MMMLKSLLMFHNVLRMLLVKNDSSFGARLRERFQMFYLKEEEEKKEDEKKEVKKDKKLFFKKIKKMKS